MEHSASGQNEAVSLSKSALLLSPCTYWAGKGVEWYDSDYNPDSKREKGTEVHSIIHSTWKTGDKYLGSDSNVYAMKEHALEWLHSQKDSGRLTHIKTEVAVSMHWETDRAEILDIENRAYPQRPGWQNGTADIVARYGNNGLYVGDWKTGDGVGWEEQVLSLLYALYKAFETQGLDLPTEFIGACLKLNEDGCWPIEKTYTVNDLELHADAMAMRWEELQSGKVTEHAAGIHCTQLYCPHLAYCDEIKSWTRKLAHADGKRHLMLLTDKPHSDAEAGEVVEMLSAVKRQIKYYDEQMKKYVEKGGRVVSGTMEWKDRGNGFRWAKQ